MRESFSLETEISSPEGAYERAHVLAEKVVTLGVVVYGNKDSAIRKITKKHGFGSFLKKVFYKEPATIHLHLYHRLGDALDQLNQELQRQIDHNNFILGKMRNKDADPKGNVASTNQFSEGRPAAI